MRSSKMSSAITILTILVFSCWFLEINGVPYQMRSEYEVNDYDNYYDENGSQRDVYESNISSFDNSHEKLKNKSQKQSKQQIYEKEDINKNDQVQINYNYNQNKYGISNSNEIDKQSELFDNGYGESIQGNINLQMNSKLIEDKKPKYNDNPIMDPVIHREKSSFFLENDETQYHSEDVSKSEEQEHTKKCTNGPLQKNQHYSQSFRQKNSSIELADNFRITGDPILKITSSVHDSEDITLCWIETTTVKEDKKAKPAKRQVFREFTISFENSAPIPDKYLDCSRMKGEILSGKMNVLKNTSFHEIIEKDTKMSKVVNLTTQSHDGNLFVTEYKLIRCSTGTSVTKDVSEWVNKAEHKKKRVEIKVGPVKKILKPKKHNDVNSDAKNLNTAEYSHIEPKDVTNCTGNVHCDEKKSIAMPPCTGVDCEQKGSSLQVLTEKISTKSHTSDVSATEIHSNPSNISTPVRDNNGLITENEEKFSTSTLSTLNLKTVILGTSCVGENCDLITTESPVKDSKNSKKCSPSSDCYFSSEVIGQQKYDNNNSSSVSTSRNCDDSFEVCNSSEFSDNSIEIPSSNDGQRLIYTEMGVLNDSSTNKNYNSFEEKITILPILPSRNSAKLSLANLKEKSNVSVMSSTDVITKDIDSTTQFVKKGNESKLSKNNTKTKPDRKQPTKNVTTKKKTDKTLPLGKKNIICSDINNCQKLADFNNDILSNYSMKITLADDVTSTKSKPNNILINSDDETEFHDSNSKCNITDSQSGESNCMKNIRFNENLSDFSKLNYDHDSNVSTTDFMSGKNSKKIPYDFNLNKDSKNKVPTLDVKSMLYRKPGKPRLALKIKLLLEQINENKEKKPLVQLEKKLTLKDNLNDDENENLISRIRALNKSTDDLQSIKDLLNCTVLGNLTDISFDINDDIRSGISNPKLQNAIKDIIHNHTEGRIENYRRKKRNIRTYVDSKKNESMQIKNIKKCLPEIRNDLKTGLNEILSKISTNLNTSRQNTFDEDTQHEIKPWKTGAIVSKNKNARVISRDKRSTQDLRNVLEWSKERIHKSADGSQLRSVTKLTAFGDFEELPEDS
ncbi:hypothetical protein HCN44_003469 [Aphidius gifuensis]|uniref:Venom protein n=1 Tax=Aphidius gifuensis TaxID=684658 RepID=A0A834XKD7_APHGI|nr:uncharacterized protein MAL13P1.304-like [Aphidius gifuensis]KAF7987606.1 hypothetical protein HCN44_003469 [Aphidius gifuensis]